MTVTAQERVARARERIREVSPAEARDRIEAGAVPLDVREAEELAAGRLPGAIHVPRGLLEFKAPAHEDLKNPDTPVVVYCKAGGRAALAAETLQELGFTDIVSIQGGYDGWTQAGNPVDAREGLDEEE